MSLAGSTTLPTAFTDAADRPRTWAESRFILVFVLLLLAMLLLMTELYVGFQAGDDKSYLTGALGWVESFPFVGPDHWTLRHTVTLPTAAFLKLFGFNEFAVSLTNSLYFILFVVMNAGFVRRFLGAGSAAVTTFLIISLPGFIVLSTFLDIGIPEIFFVSLAFWCFRLALDVPQRVGPWLASGVALGLAFITRETAASMVLFLGLVFLFKPIVSRVRYLYLFGAAATMLAIDWVYLTVMTGNPLYRLTLDLNHDRIDRFANVARVAARGGLIDQEGNISISVVLDPFLNLFISQKYTLLFWLLMPALMYLWRRRPQTGTALTLNLLAGFALLSFVFLGANPKLYLVPRYFLVTAWAAAIIVGWWLVSIWSEREHMTATLLLVAILCINAAALSVENTNPRFIERQLVSWVAAHPAQPIYTDLETIEKARYLFGFAKVSMATLSSDKPPAGAIFYHSTDRLALCASSGRCRDRVKDYTPQKEWQVQQVIRPTPRPIGKALHALNLDRLLPGDIGRRLMFPGGSIIIYRVSQPG